MYTQDAKQQLKLLDTFIKKYKQIVKCLPNGKLQCSKNGKYIKCFLINGKEKKYLAKKEKAVAEKLALKKYYESCIYDCMQEKELLERFLASADTLEKQAEKLLDPRSNYHALLANVLLPDDWAKTPYKANPYCPENLIHNTFCGIQVRSKSEAIIANALYTNGIPFRYENPLQINETTIYPDFTIRNPKTNAFSYWEHFGLMDNRDYRESAMNKINMYCENDIIPDVNLILTYETKKHPLDSGWVQQLIVRNFM